MNGEKYLTVNGKEIPNRGEQVVNLLTQEKHRCTLTFQVTDVTKPLLSVAQLAASDHEILFDTQGGLIRHRATGREIRLIRRAGLYILPIWVEPGKGVNTSENASGFMRQGAGR